MVRQHAEPAAVVHGDRPRGAAGRRLPVLEAGDAEERQHVRLGAGLNFRGAYHQPSQGERWRPSPPLLPLLAALSLLRFGIAGFETGVTLCHKFG